MAGAPDRVRSLSGAMAAVNTITLKKRKLRPKARANAIQNDRSNDDPRPPT